MGHNSRSVVDRRLTRIRRIFHGCESKPIPLIRRISVLSRLAITADRCRLLTRGESLRLSRFLGLGHMACHDLPLAAAPEPDVAHSKRLVDFDTLVFGFRAYAVAGYHRVAENPNLDVLFAVLLDLGRRGSLDLIEYRRLVHNYA